METGGFLQGSLSTLGLPRLASGASNGLSLGMLVLPRHVGAAQAGKGCPGRLGLEFTCLRQLVHEARARKEVAGLHRSKASS